ncbi:MAG: TIM barrel protein [Candidatus Anammoximicrobium sp.]|nr:TIM barrel protein [Candidatus Anammoximicrobium sp.]
MDRRIFLKSGLATACLAGVVHGAEENQTPAATGLRTKIAVAPQWFQGSHVEQIEQIAAAGFPAFETLRCGSWEDKESVRKRCEELGVACGAVGGGMGTISDWGPNDPENHPRFVEAVKTGIAQAKAIGSKRVLSLSGPTRQGVSKEEQMEALAKAGRLVAPLLEEAGIVMVWECLNVLVNHPGYFLVYSADGSELVKRTDHPNVKFLYDIYHQQISEGNLINNIKKYIGEIGHFHFADNPGRHEPGTGEINYKNVFRAIYETGFRDIVACEFGKIKSTAEVLAVLAECDRW